MVVEMVRNVMVGLGLAWMVMLVMVAVYCVQWQLQFHQHGMHKKKQWWQLILLTLFSVFFFFFLLVLHFLSQIIIQLPNFQPINAFNLKYIFELHAK